MTTMHQEIVPNPEHEAKEVDRSSQESSHETTKELFRREFSPSKEETPVPASPKSPTSKVCNKPIVKQSALEKKGSATKKKSNSGIPLRLKSGPNAVVKTATKTGTYRHSPTPQMGSFINKNTLEVQFMNNKKRLLQLHTELVEKQRPLVEMHKSLLRTKKQLEDMGKKVQLEDLKIISLKTDDTKSQMDGAGENPALETATDLKNSIENAMDACVKVCKKCLTERDHVVKILESASKFTIEPSEIEAEVEELLKDKDELEKSLENTIKENEKKIEEVLDNWQKAVKMKLVSNELATKMSTMEETINQQQKAIQEGEDNVHSLTRKFEDKKANFEKSVNEMQEKYNKLEEEMKKERKNANDNLMKTRNLRGKMNELEIKTKEAEEKHSEASNKLRQAQEQLRKKEVQWLKEKEDLKKNEALLQQKFTEKQSLFDTRLKDMDKLKKTTDMQQQNFVRNLETQLEIKEQEFALLEKEKDALTEKSRVLEDQVEHMKKQLDQKETEIDELSVKAEDVAALEYRPNESAWIELMEYKQKVADANTNIDNLNEQIGKMQNSLKTHAKLAAGLKNEKDKAMEYSNKLRDVLQEARDELQSKTRIIYKIHEKLVLKDEENKKLRAQLKEYESTSEFSGDKWRNKCQICMATMDKDASSCIESEVGKCTIATPPQYMSESLIGMSVKKVDNLRARLDNIKKMKFPVNSGKKSLNVKYSWSHPYRETQPISNHLRKQIELRGKLYKILQKHADQSCEDFINLLKLTVSSGGKEANDELKPSNMRDIDETLKSCIPQKLENDLITNSFTTVSQFLRPLSFNEIYESPNSDTDELNY